MIKIEWNKFIRGYMWFGMYWAKNGGRNPMMDIHDTAEIPGWVRSSRFKWHMLFSVKKI